MAFIGEYEKAAGEVIKAGRWGIDWKPDLESGESISVIAVEVYQESNGADVTSTIAPGAATIVGSCYTTHVITAGTAGETYRVVHKATVSEDSVFEDWFRVRVKQNE